ncbi:MAG: transposase [Desulfobaccales bacterium]
MIRPDFNRAIMIDFQGAQISSDTGFILLREIDDRFSIIDPMRDCLEDLRSPAHTKHALVQMVRQRVYQMAAGYEDCNDADFLRIDPALRLAIGKDHKAGASQSMLSRLENDVLGKAFGLEALDAALTRSTDALLRRKNKRRLIIDLDSTEDPVHGKQECVAYNLLHMIRQFYVWGEEVKRSMEWLIKRLIKVGARVSYHARRWYVHVALAFPLAHHYRSVLAWGP